ncbi:hypothetical protein H4R26_002008 [Coemansia thaxteri]|uniref:Uncharacterized protein n=1 Tax=Coemansia thaxteri TaxID=2663907 RepID=A0A9W8BKM9_9FUNG|nr:hypothetical protein H4R26_002008 [Coemansia thaxteri]KAJ2485523.1 hypothetical protein EV174_001681 [Coemansia sp. RSA 2320]
MRVFLAIAALFCPSALGFTSYVAFYRDPAFKVYGANDSLCHTVNSAFHTAPVEVSVSGNPFAVYSDNACVKQVAFISNSNNVYTTVKSGIKSFKIGGNFPPL